MNDDLAEQFRQMGVSVRNADVGEEEGGFEVWSCNWESFRIFLACETQWRAAVGMAGLVWLGLDYAAVDMVMRRMKAPDDAFEHIQIMEAAALQAFSEKS